jgi:hypothetical protein
VTVLVCGRSRVDEGMSKTWVLDTGTKGTGAHVVPLEPVERLPDAEAPATGAA